MFKPKAIFSGFSVDDQEKAKKFYAETLGLKVDDSGPGMNIQLPAGGSVFVYAKPEGHQPANYTILNFEVEDIDAAVDDLAGRGITFERYPGGPPADEKGVVRGRSQNMGPDIAWFTDPAGNVLSVMQL